MVGRDFSQRMRGLSDEDLVEIVAFARDGYLPEAAEAARKELIARNLTPPAVTAIAGSIQAERDKDAKLANLPLSWPARIAFFIFSSIGLAPIFIGVGFVLGARGYPRKSLDARKWRNSALFLG
jgi:hypothetical protein